VFKPELGFTKTKESQLSGNRLAQGARRRGRKRASDRLNRKKTLRPPKILFEEGDLATLFLTWQRSSCVGKVFQATPCA